MRPSSPWAAKRAMRTTSIARSGSMKLEGWNWPMKATWLGRARGAPPRTRIVPESGGNRPAMVLSNVVLPEPFEPTRARTVPRSSLKSISATTVSRP